MEGYCMNCIMAFSLFAKFGKEKAKDGMIASLAMSDFLQGLQTFLR